MVPLKNNQAVQLCTEDELDELPDSGYLKNPKPDINDDYSVLGYSPSAIDYIRRCRTVDEAIEIIDFLKKRGEITQEENKMLLDKLKIEGLTGFGTIKDIGFYGNIVLK